MLINDACDYIIMKLTEAGQDLNNLKLQKLLYYVQAWHLAFYGKPLYKDKEDFQAWIHGPVSREIYDRFQDKGLYSEITEDNMTKDYDFTILVEKELSHIDVILETYAVFSGTQLEHMTHEEEPWIKAREGYRPSERCEVNIDNKLMESYYKQRL